MINLKKISRKLDNTAKVFSLEEKKNKNNFRLSVLLKEEVDENILKNALLKTLDKYPNYRVKLKTGFFWNYLSVNLKEPIVEEDKEITFKNINLKKNQSFLFKVSYFQNKINLDIFHVLTDGKGATIFLKEILYNYLDLKYELASSNEEKTQDFDYSQDVYLKNANKKLKCKNVSKRAFLIKEKIDLLNNKTYHYILDLERTKVICKKNKVSITEFLTAIYIYAIYKTIYDKTCKKDISVSVPIDLRSHYQVEAFSNFFTCMNIEGKVSKNKNISFTKILREVHKDFKNKLNLESIKSYLARDVKLGTNVAIELVPLFIKKMFMKYMGKLVNQTTTTTLSNIGPIKVFERYKEYIDNIMVLVSTGKFQKAKCTVCSYENNLTVTLNSSIVNNLLEKEFYRLLCKYIGNVRLEGNAI